MNKKTISSELKKIAKDIRVNENFIKGMEKLEFEYDEDRGRFRIENSDAGYDRDCSDDERNDSFYESHSDTFYDWANPIIREVKELALKNKVKIDISKSTEYGTITVDLED